MSPAEVVLPPGDALGELVDEVDGGIGEERMAQAGGPEVVLEVGLGLGLGRADVPVILDPRTGSPILCLRPALTIIRGS